MRWVAAPFAVDAFDTRSIVDFASGIALSLYPSNTDRVDLVDLEEEPVERGVYLREAVTGRDAGDAVLRDRWSGSRVSVR